MKQETLSKGEIVIYTSADGKISLDAKLENETIWLTQDMMAKLFETTPQNITMHIRNIYDDDELDLTSTCKDFLQVRNEGKRTVSRKLSHYNLDMILSVGYRIKSKTAVQFRRWATNILKDYLVKGYAINQKVIQEQKAKLSSLQQMVDLLNRSMENQIETVEQAQNVSKILQEFVKGLNLLDDFDHKRLDNKGNTQKEASSVLIGTTVALLLSILARHSAFLLAQIHSANCLAVKYLPGFLFNISTTVLLKFSAIVILFQI